MKEPPVKTAVINTFLFSWRFPMRGRDAQVPDGINAGNIFAEGDGDALSIYCSERSCLHPVF